MWNETVKTVVDKFDGKYTLIDEKHYSLEIGFEAKIKLNFTPSVNNKNRRTGGANGYIEKEDGENYLYVSGWLNGIEEILEYFCN